MSFAPQSYQSTSIGLVSQVQRLQPAAWARLVQLYTPLVYGWTRQAGLQHSDAVDLVQEVFVGVFTSIVKFDRDANRAGFRGWLWGITRNKLSDHFRRTSRRPRAQGGSDAQRHWQELPALAPEDADEDQKLAVVSALSHRALQLIQTDFQPSTWQAFWKITVEGYAPIEAAEELNLSLTAVYKAKSRVLARLRAELEGLL